MYIIDLIQVSQKSTLL